MAAAAVIAGLIGTAKPARAASVEQNCTGLIIVTCTTPTQRPQPTPVATTPEPFVLTPITSAPSLAPVLTPTPDLTPTLLPSPSPSPTDVGVPIPIPSSTPSPTPVTVGADHNYSLPTITPSSTGTGLDGGGILIRVFFLLAVLAIVSVASMFALR